MILITYRTICDHCDNEYTETVQVNPNFHVPTHMIPKGWKTFEDSIICPKHLVQISTKSMGTIANEE